MTEIMIGGVRRPEDAAMASELGANAIGFLVEPEPESPGAVNLTQARLIIGAMRPYTSSVLSTHATNPQDVVELSSAVKANVVHVYGQMGLHAFAKIKPKMSHVKVLKAFQVEDESVIDEALSYSKEQSESKSTFLDGFVLDSVNRSNRQTNGTGLIHNWEISRRIVELVPQPVTLAGGLNPGNIAEAITAVRPYAVDVNSGVQGVSWLQSTGQCGGIYSQCSPRLNQSSPSTSTMFWR